MIAIPHPTLFPAMLGTKMQVAWVVSDLNAALNHWTEVLGVGPFVVFERAIGGRKVLHRGMPTAMDMSLAFSYVGETQIEIVHPIGDAPSPYREFLDSGREGLHHIGFWPEQCDQAVECLQGRGFSEVCAIFADDGTKSAIYYDAPPHIGVMVEIIPMNPHRMAYFGRIKALADHWDGERPVRKFPTRAEFLASED